MSSRQDVQREKEGGTAYSARTMFFRATSAYSMPDLSIAFSKKFFWTFFWVFLFVELYIFLWLCTLTPAARSNFCWYLGAGLCSLRFSSFFVCSRTSTEAGWRSTRNHRVIQCHSEAQQTGVLHSLLKNAHFNFFKFKIILFPRLLPSFRPIFCVDGIDSNEQNANVSFNDMIRLDWPRAHRKVRS